jgi:hypothetical protein
MSAIQAFSLHEPVDKVLRRLEALLVNRYIWVVVHMYTDGDWQGEPLKAKMSLLIIQNGLILKMLIFLFS